MTEQEAIDLMWKESGAQAQWHMFLFGLALLIIGFTINWLIQRSRAKAQLQKDILAELKKANQLKTVNNS